MINMEPISTTMEMTKEAVRKPEITQGEKEKFFKCVLADTPYTETMELFDGQMTVEFRTMTVQENNDVVTQIAADRVAGTAQDNDAYFITLSTYRLALCIESIDGKPTKLPLKEAFIKNIDSGDTYIAYRAKALKSWSTFKLAAFLEAFRTFEAKVVALTMEVQTKNFWKAGA